MIFAGIIQMSYVYVLRSTKNGYRYVGSCTDLEYRLRWHNTGGATATRQGVPWILVYSESFPSRTEAVRKENYYKTGQGREEMDRLGL